MLSRRKLESLGEPICLNLPTKTDRSCGCGGDAPPPPDYSPLANASKESAEIMAGVSRDQLAESKRQYDLNKVVADRVVNSQLDTMDATQKQGADYYDYMKGTFRPVEEGLVRDAENFSTKGAQEGLARQAASDLEMQQSQARGSSDRAMAAMGVNPNSGRFAGMNRGLTIQNAAARAGATTSAREKADALGFAKRMDVAGIGRNLPGASTASYQVATGSGNSAVGNQMAPGGQLMNGMAQSASTMGSGQSMQLQGLGNVLGAQTSYANSVNAANSGSDLGSIIGGAASIYKMTSSKKLKDKKTKVDAEEITEGLQRIPVEAWNYKDGVEDEGRHIGPYAEDVNREFGDVAAPGGKAIDMITMNGLAIAGVKNAADRLDRIEKKLNLNKGEKA